MPPAITAARLLTPSTHPLLPSPSPSPSPSVRSIAPPLTTPLRLGRLSCCCVSIRDDPSLTSSDKVGRKVRVRVPLKVHHVARQPGLDLHGMVGVVRQHVGVWKGKRITPNLPFKVEFLLPPVEGQAKPVKFFAHLREGELEFLTSSPSSSDQ